MATVCYHFCPITLIHSHLDAQLLADHHSHRSLVICYLSMLISLSSHPPISFAFHPVSRTASMPV